MPVHRRLVAAVASMVLVLGILPVASMSAAFAANDGTLRISKESTAGSLDVNNLKPGDEFQYKISINCDNYDCVDAKMTDVLPSELAGFEVLSAEGIGGQGSSHGAISWENTANPGTSTPRPSTLTSGTTLVVDFATGSATGMGDGSSYFLTLTLRVPTDLTTSWPSNGDKITNSATVNGVGSTDKDSADVKVVVDVVPNVDVTKTWTPATATFNPGAASSIAVAAKNTSNDKAQSLTIQEPKTAPDGASSLDASNPFTITNFTGITNTPPTGATGGTFEVYVLSGSVWNWVPGTYGPGNSLALPAGVSPANVGGVRISYTGDIAIGASGSINLGLEQRENHRNTNADLSLAPHTVNNVATGSVVAGGLPAVTDDDDASYKVTPATISVTNTKSISPSTIATGSSAVATIGATNGATAVRTLAIKDSGMFVGANSPTFAGFTSAITFPGNATIGEVIYEFESGSTQTVNFPDGALPAPPNVANGKVKGFQFKFTAPAPAVIQPGATVQAKYNIATTSSTLVKTHNNRIDTTVTAPNGNTGTANITASLKVENPYINLNIVKSINPNGQSVPLHPGDNVIANLATEVGSNVTPTKIVVEDLMGTAGTTEFWNAFNLQSVAPTQVLPGTTLTVSVRKAGGAWVTLPVYGPFATPSLYTLSNATLAAAVAPATVSSLTGINFTFENTAGFSNGVTVAPNVVFTARDPLRDGTTLPTPIGGAKPVKTDFTNKAVANGSGKTQLGDSVIALPDQDSKTVGVTPEFSGPGTVGIDKRWVNPTVNAQSGDRDATRLNWRVSPGFTKVEIADPSLTPGNGSNTVFSAFDLKSIDKIDFSNTTFSNGWFMKYDNVAAIELFDGTSWVPVSGGPWMDSTGFKGYTLTAAQSASTLGVKLILEPNNLRRAADASDPQVPSVGSGVGSNGTRQFSLDWQVRNKTRISDQWVTQWQEFNVASTAGTVRNDVTIIGTNGSGTAVDDDSDTVNIISQPPAVAVTKTAAPSTSMVVPFPNDIAEAAYPVGSYTIVAQNRALSRAHHIRVTDPIGCATLSNCTKSNPTVDPFVGVTSLAGNPYDRLNITKLTFSQTDPSQIAPTASKVWLLRENAGVFSTSELRMTSAAALTKAQLADVVGVSVTYQGTDPGGEGGSIVFGNQLSLKIDVQVRKTIRSTGVNQTIAPGAAAITVPNQAFAQSYDPTWTLPIPSSSYSQADANLSLIGGVLRVSAAKTINGVDTANVIEPNRSDVVTVNLAGNHGTSTLSPNKVVFEDTTAAFWDKFNFNGSLATVTFPSGANRVSVGLRGDFTGAGVTWVDSAANSSPGVPLVDFTKVVGIRFTFTKADGSIFSDTTNVAWSAAANFRVVFRDTLRSDPTTPVVFDGVAIPDTLNVTSSRPALSGGAEPDYSVSASDPASVVPGTGTQQLGILKQPAGNVHFVMAGERNDWTIDIRNTGTGYLDMTSIVDTLPALLIPSTDPAAVIKYENISTGATLSTTAVTAVFNPTAKTYTFTWANGNRMQPGERFRITLPLELEPGLLAGQRATNTVVAKTAQTLSACSNIGSNPNEGTTGNHAADPTTCGTTNYVETSPNPNMFVRKVVKGAIPGAIHRTTPATVCVPTKINATQSSNGTTLVGDYFRTPCAANSVVNGTDNWALYALNAGGTSVSHLTLADQLPFGAAGGNKNFVNGNSLDSAYKPQLVKDSVKVALPAGATAQIQLTWSSNVCSGTWAQGAAPQGNLCNAQGEAWETVDSTWNAEKWATATGVRVVADFTGTPSAALTPGKDFLVTFDTVNKVADATHTDGAPAKIPAADQFVWNQFGSIFRDLGSNPAKWIQKAPSPAGIHLLTGPLQITKVVTGPSSQYAPTSFQVDVSCTVGTTELAIAGGNVKTLNAANNYTVRIDGIYIGASCEITEVGTLGTYGESVRTGSPTVIDIALDEDSVGDVPASQSATVTNTYGEGSLTVTKAVDGGAAGQLGSGPFKAQVVCTLPYATGNPTVRNVTLTFDPSDPTTMTQTLANIPARAVCGIEETVTGGANAVRITPGAVGDPAKGSIVIQDSTTAAAIITNWYPAGSLEVTKLVQGAGASKFGTRDFSVELTCTLNGNSIAIVGGGVRVVSASSPTTSFTNLPDGANCGLKETATAGATKSEIVDVTSGNVVANGTAGYTFTVDAKLLQSADQPQPALNVVNTFDLTEVSVAKKVNSEATDAKGNPITYGPFEVTLKCVLDGQVVSPAEALVQTINADGTVTWKELPVGAECSVTESGTGGAVSTTVAVGTGTPTKGAVAQFPALSGTAADNSAAFVNDYDVAGLVISKKLTGTAAKTVADKEFTVAVQCTLVDATRPAPGAVVWNGSYKIGGASKKTVKIDTLAAGARCDITETATGRANSTQIFVDGVATSGPAVTVAPKTGASATKVVVENTFTAVPPKPTPSPTKSSGNNGGDKNGGNLAVTGGQVAGLLGGALLLLGAGSALLIAVRRRRNA